MIELLQERHKGIGLLERGKPNTLYIRSDGSTTQYKSANAVWILTELSRKYGIPVDWMITCAAHGKNLVDALAGRDKFDLRNGFIDGIINAMRDAAGNCITEATKCRENLSQPERGMGDTKHHRKHRKLADGSYQAVVRGDGTYVTSREYDVSNYNLKNPIPVEHCKFVIMNGGFNKGPMNQRHEMHHFWYHPSMPKC